MTELWDFLRGALMTKALAAVVDAGLPAALAYGPRPVSELHGDPDTLHRLLRALASDGVFRETEPGVFEHTDLSRQLLAPGWGDFREAERGVSEPPALPRQLLAPGWGASAHLFGGVFFEATTDLHASTSEPPFPDRFGAGFWEWLAEHPAERAAFDAAMAGERGRPAERLGARGGGGGGGEGGGGGGHGAPLAGRV